MKKLIIIYAVMFALTIIIPAIVCFFPESKANSNELVNIFRQYINLIGYYH